MNLLTAYVGNSILALAIFKVWRWIGFDRTDALLMVLVLQFASILAEFGIVNFDKLKE